MQAHIKDDKLIVNTMIHKNEKEELLKFIENAEIHGVSAETLYNIEGEKSGIAFSIKEEIE